MAQIPGWESECKEWKTARWKSFGTKGLAVPVLVSQTSLAVEVKWGTDVNCKGEEGVV